jgi:hypothetical protein
VVQRGIEVRRSGQPLADVRFDRRGQALEVAQEGGGVDLEGIPLLFGACRNSRFCPGTAGSSMIGR